MSLVHSPSAHCGGLHCFTCHVDHHPGRSDFKRCPHCNHIYRSSRDLLSRFREQAVRLDMHSLLLQFKNPNDIRNCMECLKPFS